MTDCCSDSPLASASGDQIEALATGFKMLGDPTRLQLVSILVRRECSDVCACDLAEELKLTPATISHHMSKLIEQNMVSAERVGRWVHYRIKPETFASLAAALDFSQESSCCTPSNDSCC